MGTSLVATDLIGTGTADIEATVKNRVLKDVLEAKKFLGNYFEGVAVTGL